MLVSLFIGSFQMIALGILGEYLWRVLDASRNRPLYIIEKVYE
jgi:dolichol-phosphate mannosyltransferase